MDLGESLTETAIRETLEETGWQVEVTGLVGIFSNPGHLVEYTSNGEVRQECNMVYLATAVSRDAEPDQESTEVRWVDPADLDQIEPMHPTTRYRLHLWREGETPHVDQRGDMARYLAHLRAAGDGREPS